MTRYYPQICENFLSIPSFFALAKGIGTRPSHAFEYYKSLKAEERIKLLRLLKRMGDAGEIKDTTKFNFEGDQIYTFKPKPQRFLCFFFTGKKIIITNAFCKK